MRSFADAGSSGVVKQLADNSQVTKVTGATFPTEDVIQDRPVSNVVQAEHQPPPFYTQPNVADLQSGVSIDKPMLVEGPSAKSGDERSPPFLLELFCGTAGVCAQFKTRGGRALDHHLKRTRLKAAAVKLELDATLGARVDRTGGQTWSCSCNSSRTSLWDSVTCQKHTCKAQTAQQRCTEPPATP